uniref:28S ribosomal protein S9, mitochondrial n=1 Tax=Echinococcus granulosus TaxID=6210 RepID=A0A068WEX1_ECHGR|nr:28S ribosomal protein S9, mitochondrial [Echinococcus granulosus]
MLRLVSRCILTNSKFAANESLGRTYYSTVPTSPPTGESSRSGVISASIEFYLRSYQSYENMLEEERAKYENGKKFLARLMGQDPSTFNQEQIDEAIRYLFPSGLQSRKAHPKLKPPEEVYPEKKKIQFDKTGRPFHDLFYTGKPAYYEVMHVGNLLLAIFFFMYRKQLRVSSKIFLSRVVAASEWFTKDQLSRKLLEPVTDTMYEDWLRLMNALLKHPLAWHAESFIHSYRASVQEAVSKEVFPEPQVDPETNYRYVDTYGQKKHAFVELRMTHPGAGKFIINDKRLLEFFPHLGDREQIMFPLQYTGMLGAVDVVARVSSDTETGHSSKANALRLALARALACFLPGDSGHNRLRAAGLLTQDDRFSERKKPGQKKARKKPIWKAR